MALFGTKKKEAPAADAKKAAAKPVATPSVATSSIGRDLAHVLTGPRITEKATMHQAIGVYTFDVARNATKRDIMQAVRKLYKVTPRMVRIVVIPTKTKRNMRTGKTGKKGGGKKAYIYLNKGEAITVT